MERRRQRNQLQRIRAPLLLRHQPGECADRDARCGAYRIRFERIIRHQPGRSGRRYSLPERGERGRPRESHYVPRAALDLDDAGRIAFRYVRDVGAVRTPRRHRDRRRSDDRGGLHSRQRHLAACRRQLRNRICSSDMDGIRSPQRRRSVVRHLPGLDDDQRRRYRLLGCQQRHGRLVEFRHEHLLPRAVVGLLPRAIETRRLVNIFSLEPDLVVCENDRWIAEVARRDPGSQAVRQRSESLARRFQSWK